MARLLAVCLAVLAAATGAGAAFAAGAPNDRSGGAPAPGDRLDGTAVPGGLRAASGAPVLLPEVPPTRDRVHGSAYGYRSSAALAQALRTQAGVDRTTNASPRAARGKGSASVTVVVTAVVLPMRTIVVDQHGDVTAIWSNTDDLRPRESLYVVRTGSSTGATTDLTPAHWRQASALLAHAEHATGRVA